MDNTQQQQQHPSYDEKILSERLHQNDGHILGTEQKVEDINPGGLPSRTMVPRRKNRIKEDGPLAILCGWAVQHQIGRMFPPL
jgi:hypothetical protein